MTPNTAQSIRDALKARAAESGRLFEELLQYYAMERFLYRLSVGLERDRFILKGALMLRAWNAPMSRPTRDVDLLGMHPNEHEAIRTSVIAICDRDVPEDGVAFETNELKIDPIVEDAAYDGVRVRFVARIGSARQPMRLDIGFGDAAEVDESVTYPTILDHPAPALRGYRPESSIAEKYQAIVRLGLANSRMKDYYDLWLLSRSMVLDGSVMRHSIQETFRRRATLLQKEPAGLSTQFAGSAVKIAQWNGFVARSMLASAPRLEDAVEAAVRLVTPPTRAVLDGVPFEATWEPPGNWKPSP